MTRTTQKRGPECAQRSPQGREGDSTTARGSLTTQPGGRRQPQGDGPGERRLHHRPEPCSGRTREPRAPTLLPSWKTIRGATATSFCKGHKILKALALASSPGTLELDLGSPSSWLRKGPQKPWFSAQNWHWNKARAVLEGQLVSRELGVSGKIWALAQGWEVQVLAGKRNGTASRTDTGCLTSG